MVQPTHPFTLFEVASVWHHLTTDALPPPPSDVAGVQGGPAESRIGILAYLRDGPRGGVTRVTNASIWANMLWPVFVDGGRGARGDCQVSEDCMPEAANGSLHLLLDIQVLYLLLTHPSLAFLTAMRSVNAILNLRSVNSFPGLTYTLHLPRASLVMTLTTPTPVLNVLKGPNDKVCGCVETMFGCGNNPRDIGQHIETSSLLR